MPIAIVYMANRTDSNMKLESMPYLIYNNITTAKSPTKIGANFFKDKQFRWTELEQQLILGAYWVGYIVTLVPGNYD